MIVLSFITFALCFFHLHQTEAVVRIGFGALGCWRDYPTTRAQYSTAIEAITTYINDDDRKESGGLLRQISEIIWPSRGIAEDFMYCFDDEYHGDVDANTKRNYISIMEDFRSGVNATINVTSLRNVRTTIVGEALENLHVTIADKPVTFLAVFDIEKSSLFLREYSLLLLGSLAEIINYCKTSCNAEKKARWQTSLENNCYVLSKFSYWFLR